MGDPTSPRKDMKMARSLSPLVLEPRGCRVPALPEALLGPWGAGRARASPPEVGRSPCRWEVAV